MKKEVMHYVKFVRFTADLPPWKMREAAQAEYPNDTLRFIEHDERGTVFEISSPLPGRLE